MGEKYEPIEVVVLENLLDAPKLMARKAASPEAHLAFQFIEHWGMVAGIPDGESSSGYPRIRLSTPQEVVQRAFEVATLAYQEAAARGMLTDIPLPQTWEEKEAEREAKRAEKRASAPSKDL